MEQDTERPSELERVAGAIARARQRLAAYPVQTLEAGGADVTHAQAELDALYRKYARLVKQREVYHG